MVGSERVVVILESKTSRNGGCSGALLTSRIVLTAAHCLGKPGKNGQAHNDTVMRWITNEYPREVKGAKPGWMDEYLENWELLS